MAWTAGSMATLLNAELRGDAEATVDDVRTIPDAGPTHLAFAGDDKFLKKLKASAAGVALVAKSLAKSLADLTGPKAVLLVDDPQAAVATLLEKIRPFRPRPNIGRSTQALISPSARLGEGTNIHPGAIIGDDVTIGRNGDIHPGVVIGPGCVLGDDVTIFPNSVLYHDVVVGNRVILHAGVVIGGDGFGYRFVKGRHQKVTHYGTVRIEDDVEIGANATVDRAVIGATVIGAGTKIDNLVQVAHNVTLGRHNVLASQVGFAGSSKSGDYCVFGGQAGVADHVELADKVTLGAKAAAHRNLESGTYHGIPVLPEIEALRVIMATRKLPEMKDQLKELNAQVKALTARLDAQEQSKAA